MHTHILYVTDFLHISIGYTDLSTLFVKLYPFIFENLNKIWSIIQLTKVEQLMCPS